MKQPMYQAPVITRVIQEDKTIIQPAYQQQFLTISGSLILCIAVCYYFRFALEYWGAQLPFDAYQSSFWMLSL